VYAQCFRIVSPKYKTQLNNPESGQYDYECTLRKQMQGTGNWSKVLAADIIAKSAETPAMLAAGMLADTSTDLGGNDRIQTCALNLCPNTLNMVPAHCMCVTGDRNFFRVE
jgi:hypothetical protein